MRKIFAIILAAGKGSRMKSDIPKMLHLLAGKPIIKYITDKLKQINGIEILTIINKNTEIIKNYLFNDSKYIFQSKSLGTANALLQAKSYLEKKDGISLVIVGDAPFIKLETFNNLISFHKKTLSKLTILTSSIFSNDEFINEYGKIIKNSENKIIKIDENIKLDNKNKINYEINSGVYCFDNLILFKLIDKIKLNNVKKEYYLTDIVEIFFKNKYKISTFFINNKEEIMGINDKIALSKASNIMYNKINEFHMKNGVIFINPFNTYIDENVIIGKDTIIETGVYLIGNTIIGKKCFIGNNSKIKNSKILDNVVIKSSIIENNNIIENNVKIGPFSHLRENNNIKKNVFIGNFVEIKNSIIFSNTKIGHMSYIGDAELKENVNIGCGVVFANYNGKNKNKIFVENNVFIGSSSTLVAPVIIKKNSFIAAGSTITENVNSYDLAIARTRQINKIGYFKKNIYNNNKLKRNE